MFSGGSYVSCVPVDVISVTGTNESCILLGMFAIGTIEICVHVVVMSASGTNEIYYICTMWM